MITKADIYSPEIKTEILKESNKFSVMLVRLLKNNKYDSVEVLTFLTESVGRKVITKTFISKFNTLCKSRNGHRLSSNLDSIKDSEDNPWNTIQVRSKYLSECKLIHEVLSKDFMTPAELHSEYGVSRSGFNFAMSYYFIKGIDGWKGVSKRVGREVSVKIEKVI